MSYSIAKCEREETNRSLRFEDSLLKDDSLEAAGGDRDVGGRARAATRAFELIEFFQTNPRPARTTEIGKALGIPNSSADDLLRALLAKGYLSYNAQTKYYSPSYRLIHVTDALMDGFPLLDSLHELETNLCQQTGQTIVIVAQEGAMYRVVSAQNGIGPIPECTIGAIHPLARYHEKKGWRPTSNLASAILAANRDRDVVEILGQLDQPGRLTNYLPLLEQVRSIRTAGVAECHMPERDMSSLAWGIDRGSKLPVIAIACVGAKKDVERWRHVFRSHIASGQNDLPLDDLKRTMAISAA